MNKATSVTRRNFIKTGAVAAGAVALSAKSHARVRGANDRLNVGFIGCGGMAGSHLGSLLAMQEDENIAVRRVCDVYRTRAEEFRDRIKADGGKAKISRDHRKVLSDSKIDYVVIATPEHSHHRLVIDALEAGKHVYCEKPLCHNIKDAKEVVAKVKETGLQLQVGVQGMADDSYSSAHEAILAGKLGPVVEAQIDYVRNHSLDRGPWRTKLEPNIPKPDDLDWKTWLNPVQDRPWDAHRYFEWRCYRDYSGGIATDLFVHRITRLIKACGLTYPSRAVGMGGIYMWDDGRDLPDNFEMMLEYPAIDGVTPGMTLHILGTMSNQNGNRHCIRGHRATLFFTSKGWEIVAEGSKEVLETHTKTGGEDVTPHHKNHHGAIREGVALNCPAELGLYGVVAVRMGNLSWFERKMVAWDYEREQVLST